MIKKLIGWFLGLFLALISEIAVLAPFCRSKRGFPRKTHTDREKTQTERKRHRQEQLFERRQGAKRAISEFRAKKAPGSVPLIFKPIRQTDLSEIGLEK